MNTKLDKKVRLAMGDNLMLWLKIAHGNVKDKGVRQNPLCRLFIQNVDCEGCPIKNKTGQSRCVGTPYPNWLMHHVLTHKIKFIKCGYKVECSECKEIARDMYDFYLDMLFER